jgi:hypothetical protein
VDAVDDRHPSIDADIDAEDVHGGQTRLVTP